MQNIHKQAGEVGSTTNHHDNSTSPSPATSHRNVVINKPKPFHKAKKAVYKVAERAKAVSKKRFSRNRSRNQELKEFRRRWQKETDILSRVIQLEQELGREPELNDLLGKFNRSEIDAVWDSLLWLYPNFRTTTAVPELELVIA